MFSKSEKLSLFTDGAVSIFNINPTIKLSEQESLFQDNKKNLQEEYWGLTGSHIRKQISCHEKK